MPRHEDSEEEAAEVGEAEDDEEDEMDIPNGVAEPPFPQHPDDVRVRLLWRSIGPTAPRAHPSDPTRARR